MGLNKYLKNFVLPQTLSKKIQPSEKLLVLCTACSVVSGDMTSLKIKHLMVKAIKYTVKISKGILGCSWFILIILVHISWSWYHSWLKLVYLGWSELILKEIEWSWLISINQNYQIMTHSRVFTRLTIQEILHSIAFQKFHSLENSRISTLSTSP